MCLDRVLHGEKEPRSIVQVKRARGEPILFRDLKVGQTFDWVSPEDSVANFAERCTKTGKETYDGSFTKNLIVKNIDAVVCNVGEEP